MQLNRALIFFSGLIILASCKDNKPEEGPEFNRTFMLENIASSQILPAYASCDSAALNLKDAVSKVPAELGNAQSALKKAWEAWQYCSVFEIGPAMNKVLRQNLNTYPADTLQIGANARSGTYDLGSASNLDAKGFPGLDFLLNGKRPGDATPADKYTGSDSLKYKSYLVAITTDLYSRIHEVNQLWKSGYNIEFSQKSGTSVGSSTGDLVNEMNFDLELVKNYKIGLPFGAKTLGTPQPDKTESFYGSSYSVNLALLNIRALKNVFKGGNGQGFDDYLEFIDAKHNGTSLAAKINEQFNIVEASLLQVPEPLSTAVINEKTKVETAYNEIKKLSVLLKTDMPSALGVLITYQDNDGD